MAAFFPLLQQLQSWPKPLRTLVLTERENARADIMSLSRVLEKLAKVIGWDVLFLLSPSPPSNVDCDKKRLEYLTVNIEPGVGGGESEDKSFSQFFGLVSQEFWPRLYLEKELDRIQNSSSYGQQSYEEPRVRCFWVKWTKRWKKHRSLLDVVFCWVRMTGKREARMSHEMALGGHLDIGTGMILLLRNASEETEIHSIFLSKK